MRFLKVLGITVCVLMLGWISARDRREDLERRGDGMARDLGLLERFRRLEDRFREEQPPPGASESARRQFLADHLLEYGKALEALKSGAEPERAEALLQQGLELNPDPGVRAVLSFQLGELLEARAEAIWQGPEEERAAVVRRARDAYERATCEGGIDFPGVTGTIRERAETRLKWLVRTGIGEPAPEIEGPDEHGVPMRLSDFRGKVVALYFWGDW
jgi:hypothetical protein